MTSADKALQTVLQHSIHFGVEPVPLMQAHGRILAQAVIADRDLPPFHRVTMDGVAINTKAIDKGIHRFTIEGIQAAGSAASRLSDHHHCIEVMTGAMLPENTDAVIPYEQCTIAEGTADIGQQPVSILQYVHTRGMDGKAGQVLIEQGIKITPAVMGILASVGWSSVPVFRLPTIALCSTGDELVDIDQQPEAHQVRRSNVYALGAALLQEGIQAALYHLPDDPVQMTEKLTAILGRYEIILFSGAVSKGKFDYLPQVLGVLGMQTVFHQVAQRPGKPFLFGTLPGNRLVFAFPGNPVSTFVCYHLYFRPWLYRSMQDKRQQYSARLTRDVVFKPQLAYHILVRLAVSEGVLLASPGTGSGSGDLMSMVGADAIMTLPPDRDVFYKGESFAVTLL